MIRLCMLLRPSHWHANVRTAISHQCFPRRSLWETKLRNSLRSTAGIRPFHSSKPVRTPIIPLPAVLAVLKTGKFFSFISFSSKTSLTLLPHTFGRHRARSTARFLASIPFIGFTFLVLVGLDQAPNTSRLRFIYLSEEEEEELVRLEVGKVLQEQAGLIAPKDNEYVRWLQEIVDNISAVAVDDIRDPVRRYDQPGKPMDLYIICDHSTPNAMCAGSKVLVYNLMIHIMEYDTDRMAAVLAHEVAHSIQRHSVEAHGFASVMLMLGDITRGLFWIITESLGPYINQQINDVIAEFINLEKETTYNRQLEREADLVGLKLMAKAGYDPRAAVSVWSMMAELQHYAEKGRLVDRDSDRSTKGDPTFESLETDWRAYIDSMLNSWFGSTHPADSERVEYLQAHMDEAVALYEESIRINGPKKRFVFSADGDNHTLVDTTDERASFFSWLSWLWPLSHTRSSA